MTSLQPALTFGVEIEFAIASLNPGAEDPHPKEAPNVYGLHLDDENTPQPLLPNFEPKEMERCAFEEAKQLWSVQLHIAKVLTAAGIPCITGHEMEVSNKCRGKEKLGYWIIDKDSSIVKPRGESPLYHWYAVEINSPAFYCTRAAVDQVKTVCALLTKSFRINCNQSCGLHVHVGQGKESFSADHLRTLMAMLYVFEPQLDTLHPLQRRGQENIYCRPLNTNTKLVWQNKDLKSRSEFLREILRIEDKNTIIENFSVALNDTSTHKLVYNLSNMQRMTGHGLSPHRASHTIEFRQHESTLDPERIGKWIRTCVGLVEVPLRNSKQRIESYLYQHVDDTIEKLDIIKLLLALRLTAEADFYDARLHTLWVKNGKTVTRAAQDEN